jgi:hypothetical protein
MCVVIATITPFDHLGLELNFCGQTNPPTPTLPLFNKQCGPSMWPAWNCSCLSKSVGLYVCTMRRDKKTKQNNHHKCIRTYVCVCVCVCVCALVRCCVYKVCDEFSKKPTTIGGRCATWQAHQRIFYSKRVNSLSLSLFFLCTTRNGIDD